jgi:aminoglycoside phosphotransferase (APT) family kinase protein
MPVPHQRDPDLSRARLGEWLAAKMPDARRLRISRLDIPRSGFSAQTLLFEAAWQEAGRSRRQRMVARIAGRSYELYPQARLDVQFTVMNALGGRTDVPVPKVHWFESDPSVLGGPFFVMDYVAGNVPADLPSYHRAGWLAGLSVPRQRKAWFGAVAAMERVHRIEPAALRALGLEAAELPGRGATRLARHLDYYERHLAFFGCDSHPVALGALDWLREHQPRETDPGRLLWGDARMGNIVFVAAGPAALLDWEMTSLGQPEADLAWFLYLDRHLSEGIGAPRLPGLPGRAETVAWYEKLSGRTVRHLDYYEVFAGFRLMLITARLTSLVTEHQMVPPGTDFPLARNAARLLERTLPGPAALPVHDAAGRTWRAKSRMVRSDSAAGWFPDIT